jgi:hypothetical protein
MMITFRYSRWTVFGNSILAHRGYVAEIWVITSVITVDTNELLDRMGLKQDSRGIHRSGNRERLRDALNAAHNLVIIGEYTTWENGQRVRKAIRKTVLSLIGATFDADESANLSTLDLFERGLPKSMQIRLNFYDGIRRPDGTLGNQYVLMTRLAEPQKLMKANYSATHDGAGVACPVTGEIRRSPLFQHAGVFG